MPDVDSPPAGGDGTKAAHEKPHPITKAVMDMLQRKGVARSDYAATIAEIIQLNPVSARRRLNDESSWTYDDIQRLAERFGDEPMAIIGSAFQGTAPLQGRVEIGDISLPCSFWIDPQSQFHGPGLVGPMVALEPLTDAEPWSIVPIDQRGGRSAHALHSLVVNFQRCRRRVAVIDDDPAVSDGLAALLRLKGMDAKPFSSAEQFLAAHREHAFDAFIVDWCLGSGDTRELLTQIRASSQHAPLLVLTGRIGTENVREREVDAAVHAVGGDLMEKPAKILKVMRYLQKAFSYSGARIA